MSLDVYLTYPEPSTVTAQPAIFVRRAGATVQISGAEWDRLNPGAEPATYTGDDSELTEAYHANITHNLNTMASAAGIHPAQAGDFPVECSETFRRCAVAHPLSPDHPIVGAWQLVSFTEKDIETGAVTHPMGEQAKAAVIYTAEGHVVTLFTAEDRHPPLAPLATDREAIDLYRSMIAFAGRYELTDAKLVYRPEISWNEVWNGTRQERVFEVSRSRLEVSSEPAVSALTGRMTIFSLIWERMP